MSSQHVGSLVVASACDADHRRDDSCGCTRMRVIPALDNPVLIWDPAILADLAKLFGGAS